jgi:hypothetical protein
MRVLVISRPTPTPIPPEMMPGMLQAFKGWREKWRPKMEAFEFFAVGAGGWGVINAANDRELTQIMLEYPLQPFTSNELLPTLNGDEGLEMLIETVNQMMAAMQQGH